MSGPVDIGRILSQIGGQILSHLHDMNLREVDLGKEEQAFISNFIHTAKLATLSSWTSLVVCPEFHCHR